MYHQGKKEHNMTLCTNGLYMGSMCFDILSRSSWMDGMNVYHFIAYACLHCVFYYLIIKGNPYVTKEKTTSILKWRQSAVIKDIFKVSFLPRDSEDWSRVPRGGQLGCASSLFKQTTSFICPQWELLPCFKIKITGAYPKPRWQLVILSSYLSRASGKTPLIFQLKCHLLISIFQNALQRSFWKKISSIFDTWFFEKPAPFGYKVVFKFYSSLLLR